MVGDDQLEGRFFEIVEPCLLQPLADLDEGGLGLALGDVAFFRREAENLLRRGRFVPLSIVVFWCHRFRLGR